MGEPRKPEVDCGFTYTEMDIVRAIIGEAYASGLGIKQINQQIMHGGVETLEDWRAAFEADLVTLTAMGRI